MKEPKCVACRKPFSKHLGVQGLCEENQRLREELSRYRCEKCGIRLSVEDSKWGIGVCLPCGTGEKFELRHES